MVLPLLFALGAQYLAANAGATALAAGLASAGGNALGQLIQNKKVNWGDAALSGIGAGISAGFAPGAKLPGAPAGHAANVAGEAAKP